MTNDQVVLQTIKHSLKEMAFEDINRASSGGAKMGAFILASCFIEYLAGFRFGKETTATDYRNFVKEYLGTKYDETRLYKDLRCKLVHNYSEGGSYIFTDNKPSLHKHKSTDGRTILNLEDFLKDLELAMNAYFTKLDLDPKLGQQAIKRFKQIGLLQVMSFQHNNP